MTHQRNTREFHVLRSARQRYRFDDALFSLKGHVIFANYHAARIFAHKMNSHRDLIAFPEQAVRAGDLYAMGLIDEILHYMISIYRQQVNPRVMHEAGAYCRNELGHEHLDRLSQVFVTEFPPLHVHQQKMTADAYLADSENIPVVLEEILMLWLANINPAFSEFRELFDDRSLEMETAYHPVIESLNRFFKSMPVFGPGGTSLIDLLRAPAMASPHSLTGQLDYIRIHWGHLIQDRYLYKLLSSIDFIREENKLSGFGPGPAVMPDFAGGSEEAERFSPDLHWMPRVVMIAKNVHVWMDQLSRQTGQPVNRLDQIPDPVLEQLSAWGFTALWLIGIWERSPASKRIKQLCGNPEAEASAYALYDYRIAQDLGGEQAFQNLADRAWKYGIRMAGDMVPNHVGIDGRWVVEHPDWFVSLPYSPFPSYTFNGPDLSHDERVGIYLEDHYYTRSDAAVVFRRRDHWTGDERFIYHGNDGTSMPWNDTAQLNFLNPEVREAVIQTILHVARQFPVIRFDAAMTLTQKHFQRLWFPEPGHGGDIASRAEQAMSRAGFLERMPVEFWREVVDRVAAEAPDTLLLAEAFWLLEGYFVRTLGMHRVYNSAFMNMLKTEDNAGYRSLIRKTLEFNPEILKRFVNFMNNPDEDTAVAQFGKDDKYFGVCLLMLTMPGLPMFGHGQVEGYSEKYGMEYRRAYWDEQPESWLVERHEREVFPVMRKRALFADVANYCLYDLVTTGGTVNEHVYAQSNRSGGDAALYVFHNTWGETRGWIRSSVNKGQTLGEGLNLSHHAGTYTIFRDHITGLEYIRSTPEFFETGLYVELGAFKYHLFWNFRQVSDEGDYRRIHELLDGRGVPDMDEALKALGLKSVLDPYQHLMDAGMVKAVLDAMRSSKSLSPEQTGDLRSRIQEFYRSVQEYTGRSGDLTAAVSGVMNMLQFSLKRPPASGKQAVFVRSVTAGTDGESLAVFSCILIQGLCPVPAGDLDLLQCRSWMDELMLGKVISQICGALGMQKAAQDETVMLIRALLGISSPVNGSESTASRALYLCRQLFADPDIQQFCLLNRYQETLYFNRERFELLIRMIFAVEWIRLGTLSQKTGKKMVQVLMEMFDTVQETVSRSEYRVEVLLQLLGENGHAS
ncbi:alpha-amylase [bacterium]|nr:alpha-amylase [bacterium]